MQQMENPLSTVNVLHYTRDYFKIEFLSYSSFLYSQKQSNYLKILTWVPTNGGVWLLLFPKWQTWESISYFTRLTDPRGGRQMERIRQRAIISPCYNPPISQTTLGKGRVPQDTLTAFLSPIIGLPYQYIGPFWPEQISFNMATPHTAKLPLEEAT